MPSERSSDRNTYKIRRVGGKDAHKRFCLDYGLKDWRYILGEVFLSTASSTWSCALVGRGITKLLHGQGIWPYETLYSGRNLDPGFVIDHLVS